MQQTPMRPPPKLYNQHFPMFALSEIVHQFSLSPTHLIVLMCFTESLHDLCDSAPLQHELRELKQSW